MPSKVKSFLFFWNKSSSVYCATQGDAACNNPIVCALSFPSVGLSSFCSPSKAYLFDSPSGPCHDSVDLRLSIAGRRGPVDSIQKLFPFICDGVL